MNTPITEVTIGQLPELIMPVINAGLVPMLHGRPGLGKSAIIKWLAEEYNLFFIDIRLSTYDPVALNGFPFINEETMRSDYIPPSIFPLEGDDLPLREDGSEYDGWLINFDEISGVTPAVQLAAYRILLDKEVGEHKIHKNVAMMCAGNSVGQGAVANKLSTALQARLIHFPIRGDIETFVTWGEENGINHKILAYVQFAGVSNFDPKHKDLTFSCERTWEFASKLTEECPNVESQTFKILMQGAIGAIEAAKFVAFCKIYKELPTLQSIIDDPFTANLPTGTDKQYAIAGVIDEHISEDNYENCLEYISRLNFEMQIVVMRGVVNKIPNGKNTAAYKRWRAQYAKQMSN